MTDQDLEYKLNVLYNRCEELKKDRSELISENQKLREMIHLMADEFNITLTPFKEKVGLDKDNK